MQFIIRLIVFFATSVFALTANAAEQLNMPYGVSPISQEIYKLHMAAFYVCCVIGAIVFGVLIYSLIKFRKSKGAQAAHFHEHLGIEILWTTVPFLILVALAIPATIVLQKIHNTDAAPITIKITGYQWKWKYEYLDQNVSFFSTLSTPQDQINNKAKKDPWYLLEVDKPLVIPINTKVRILVTADDVIHAWWVPDLGVKQDAIPGYINENWVYATKPGIYRGQCGELCGMGHGFMPIVVQAVSQADFTKWLSDQQKAAQVLAQTVYSTPIPEAELVNLGKKLYDTNCALCHQNSGLGLLPNFPALKNDRVVTSSLDANIAFVMHGVPGTPMQAYGRQLDDKSIAAIITYIRHAWGNDAIIKGRQYPLTAQPQDVQRIRKILKM